MMSKTRNFRLIGLTGGIASGKSTAARVFQEMGIAVLDADQISRELSQPGGAAHEAIVRKFGTADRAALRQLVFQDAQKRADLEAILHPLIAEKSADQAAALAAGSQEKDPIVLYEAALLVETARYRDLDGLIVVEAPAPVRVKRLVARDRISEDMALRMIQSQTSDETRRAAATFILNNDGDETRLRDAVRSLLEKLRSSGKS